MSLNKIILYLFIFFFPLTSIAMSLDLTESHFESRYRESVNKSNITDAEKSELTLFKWKPFNNSKSVKSALAADTLIFINDANNDDVLESVSLLYPSQKGMLSDTTIVSIASFIDATIGKAQSSDKKIDYIKSIPGIRKDKHRSVIVDGFKLSNTQYDSDSQIITIENISNKDPNSSRYRYVSEREHIDYFN